MKDKKLPAFKITYTDGTSYVTSMAHGTSLSDARVYFMAKQFVQSDETTMKTVAYVERACFAVS